MNTNEILEAIDQDILKLQQARALLTDAPAIQAAKPSAGKRRGRPKGSISKKAEVAALVATKPGKRTMSAEGKARIAAAQKARWAVQKKAIAKPAAKKIAVKSGKKATPPSKTVAKKPTVKKIAAKVSKKLVIAAKKTVAAASPAPPAEA